MSGCVCVYENSVDNLALAMSDFCLAMSAALWAERTALSTRSRTLLDRKIKSFEVLPELTSTLFLYLPSSLEPSLSVVTPYPYFLLLNHSPEIQIFQLNSLVTITITNVVIMAIVEIIYLNVTDFIEINMILSRILLCSSTKVRFQWQ